MDMNQLFYHHQIALMAAARAERRGEVPAPFNLSDHYAKRIDQYRSDRGLPRYFGKPNRADVVSVATIR